MGVKMNKGVGMKHGSFPGSLAGWGCLRACNLYVMGAGNKEAHVYFI